MTTRSTRAATWRTRAENALAAYESFGPPAQPSVFALAYAMQTTAWLRGWDDPAISDYLSQIYALVNPDGGYGLNRSYDAHGNGTINPASTTYTVTISGHVGEPFLQGYLHGVVPAAKVQKFIDLITTAPRIDTTEGRGVAYSLNPNDAKPGLLVHNVNAGAAAFLMRCSAAGFAIPWWLVQGIVKREMSAYNQATRFWPYRDNMAPAPQDVDHNSWNAESMYLLAPSVGYSSVYKTMTTEPDADPNTPIAYMRLAGLDPMAGTDWAAMSDTWEPVVEQFVTDSAALPVRLAQVAYYSARVSLVADA